MSATIAVMTKLRGRILAISKNTRYYFYRDRVIIYALPGYNNFENILKKEVNMIIFRSKKITSALFLSIVFALGTPVLSQAEDNYDTGDVAASRAAEQRAAIAKRKERIKKEKAEAAAKKAAESQPAAEQQAQPVPANTQPQ